MKNLFVSILSACAMPMALAAESAPNKLTNAEKADGWVLLFDGEDPSEHFRGYRKDDFPATWVVEDGALYRKGRGDIITREKYGSFELRIDWKISEGGNSGIIFKVVENEGPPYNSGPEAQLLDNVKGTHPQKAGWLFALYAADKDTTKPAGEWNQFVLKCRKTPKGTYRCEHWMNGEKYVEYEIGSEDWFERVAKSKYRNAKNFGMADEGHICLQDHGDEVWFRNIRIRELRPEE
jgi:hypothetical protein